MDLIARLNAALAGRYRVERPLGEGGMATVYLARDLRHNRNVALKVLKPDLAAAIGAERFLAEIETTANLQHPHILPLHDSGEADALLFYTMPYVEEETLRQRLDRDGRLPVEEAVRIAHEIADALQMAHELGVIHRDIKPSNILLSRGRALVADFGIARAVRSSDASRLTQAGGVIGTVGYMSPEQASGADEVDHRSDIYSLACVLFEMLAGEPPYPGRTILDVLTKQATAPVPSVRARRPDVPSGLDGVVSRALAKDPAGRFKSAAEFAGACERNVLAYLLHPSQISSAVRLLGALAAHAPGDRGQASPPSSGERREAPTVELPSARTLVVLPFVNRSADPDNEYFSDGLTDEVISDLSRIAALRVISRNSSMALKATTKDTRTLARELGVTHLVTGSVRRAGQSLRITADLVDASTDSPIWSEKFSGSMDDVFGIQEDISRQIVAALQVTLTATESREVAQRPIADPVAYDCYLRACHLMYDWTPEAQRHAMRLVGEAISISGEVPLLLAMQGQLHWNRVNIPHAPGKDSVVAGEPAQPPDETADPIEQALARAEELAHRALAQDPDLHLAIFVRGLVAGTRGRPEAGLVDLHRAHALRPSDANVLLELNRYSLAAGLDCRRTVDRLVAIDPLIPQSHLMVAMYHGLYGRPAEVAAPARRSLELAPEASFLHVSAAWWIALAGLRSEAAAILRRIRSEAGDLRGSFASFLLSALEGDEEGARRAVTPEMERAISNEYLCLFLAQGWALLGRKDDAVRALRAAMRLGFINYRSLVAADGPLAGLRGTLAFDALLAEIEPRWKAVVEWHRGLGEDRTLTAHSPGSR